MDAARQEGYRAGAALFSAFVIGRPGRECTHFCACPQAKFAGAGRAKRASAKKRQISISSYYISRGCVLKMRKIFVFLPHFLRCRFGEHAL